MVGYLLVDVVEEGVRVVYVLCDVREYECELVGVFVSEGGVILLL